MSVVLVCPQCERRHLVPDEVVSSNLFYICSQCRYRNYIYRFQVANIVEDRGSFSFMEIGSGSITSRYTNNSYSAIGSANTTVEQSPSIEEMPPGIRSDMREELNWRLISVVPDSILMDVINSMSNQISLRMQRDTEDFGRRPTLNLRCTIDDRRNGLYVVPIECKRCKFIFYINDISPLGDINLHCPKCGRDLDQEAVQNSKVPNKTKTIVKKEVKEDEGRRIRCGSRE